MATIVRCGTAAIGLFVVAAGIAAEKNPAVLPKSAIDGLITLLDNISRDPDMTTAKKAIVAADAIEKFNQQYKGKTLSVRLKVQDLVPYSQGNYLTANRPDLDGVQFSTGKFQTNLSNAEVMSVTKERVMVVTGMVSATNQPRPHIRSDILKPGSSIAFPLRSNPACQICLENVSYQLEVAPKAKPDALPAAASRANDSPLFASGKTTGGNTLADKLKNEQLRTVDDVKSFFLKGIVQNQHPYGSKNTDATGRAGTSQSSGWNARPASGYGTGSNSGDVSAKVKHNRVYTTAEIMQKFGNPSSRSSTTTLEHWVYKCKDGVVHVHFAQVGYAGSSSTSKSETLRLEVKSVDSSSSPSAGTGRF
ncbi:MAG: hypothetical protein ACLP9L_36100 [Thermoguttaceae bacterium]